MPVTGDGMSTLSFFTFLFSGGVNFVHLNEMPVFCPNEYFWKHHWDGKEEKWMCYARAMQHIIADAGGMQVSNSSVNEKLQYRDMQRKNRLHESREKEE